MADINTVSLSGVLSTNVETSRAKGVPVARFFIDVEGAGDQRPKGNFKVVAFADLAEVARKLSEGDRVVLVGTLLERRGRGRREMEIRVRNLIPLPKEAPHEERAETKVEDEVTEEDVDKEIEE